jgi:ribosomal-protein-serine acetyltransferase
MNRNEIFNVKNMPSIIPGNKITLKLVEPTISNAKEAFNLIDKNRKHLSIWIPSIKDIKSANEEHNYMLKAKEDFINNHRIAYGIFYKNQLIGRINCFGKQLKNGIAEISFWLSEKHIKKGYITETIEILEKELFAINMHKIQIKNNAKNIASRKTAEKSNYKLEAILEDNYFQNNEYIDVCIYSKINKS